MADHTHIEWTDATWNPITGCSVTSPGCTNCYAMKLAGTRLAHHPSRAGLTHDTKAGPVWTGEVRLNEQWLTQPLKWRRPRRIFVCAHGDLFHEAVPDEWIDRVFAVMALAPQHTFQVLTKRSARMRDYCQSRNSGGTSAIVAANALDNANWLTRELAVKSEPQFQNIWPLPNVWLGVSVEDQARADQRIPDLLATPAAVRWLSCEPLLGPVDLGQLLPDLPANAWLTWLDYLDWIIVGGESGQGARPMHPDWARSLRDQCAATGVPFLFKQWGEWAPPEAIGATSFGPVTDRNGGVGNWQRQYIVCGDLRADRLNAHNFDAHAINPVFQVGKKRAGRLLDGVLHDAFPAVR